MFEKSKSLERWATALLFGGIALLIVGIVGWVFTDSGASEIIIGMTMLVLSPAFRGLSVLVMNAERQLLEHDDTRDE